MKNHNVDAKILDDNDPATLCRNVVRFSPVTPEARMCTAGVDQYSGLFHYYWLGDGHALPRTSSFL